MEHEKVVLDGKTLILSLGVVFFFESGMRMLVWGGVQNSLMLLGGVRLLEATFFLLLCRSTDTGFSAIGLEKGTMIHGIRRGLLWSAFFGAAAVSVLVVFQAMGVDLSHRMRIPLPADGKTLFLFFLVGGVIGPVAEELFFRGIVYGFIRRWGRLPAIFFSTLLFVLAHPVLPAIPVIPITGGLLFAIAYEMEGTLMVPIVLHILGNLALYTISVLFG